MTVIGWKDITYVAQINTWLSSFLIHSGAGNTISAAISYADSQVQSIHNGDMGGLGSNNIVVDGSQTQKLVS